jgi:hypothetical protein
MRRLFGMSFLGLMLVSILVWILGLLTAAVVPWFGGIRAERIGELGFTVGLVGESCTYIFAWLKLHFTEKRRQSSTGISGPKRFGNKKSPTEH